MKVINIMNIKGDNCMFKFTGKLISKTVILVIFFFLFNISSVYATRYQSVMFGGNYSGGQSFDDNLSLSMGRLATSFDSWSNWDRGGNMLELAGNTNHNGIVNSINRFSASGADALKSGDVFVFSYFGHGGSDQGIFEDEFSGVNLGDEFLALPDGGKIYDDELTQIFNSFNEGVIKLFMNISCLSGGFWGGNDLFSGGDLEQSPGTVLMSSSREGENTYPGGTPGDDFWWEPEYLTNLIDNMNYDGSSNSITIGQLHNRSAANGSAINSVAFDDWDTLKSGEFHSELFSQNSFDLDVAIGVAVPEPSTIVLLLLGVFGLVIFRRKFMTKSI
jgi:hypothetical protein